MTGELRRGPAMQRDSWLALVLMVSFSAAELRAQSCNLTDPPCSGTDCAGGCAGSFPVSHGLTSPCNGGSFVLTGTRFANTCLLGDCISPACPRALPPIRFWRYDNYGAANSGCNDPLGQVPTSCDFMSSWLTNPSLDFGVGPPEHWVLLGGANWMDPTTPAPDVVDGCVSNPTDPVLLRTVVELRGDENTSTPVHDSWYLAVAVRESVGAWFNFDWITGSGVDPDPALHECAPGAVRVRSVPQPVIAGLTPADCLDPAVYGQSQPPMNGYFHVTVSLEATPAYFTDAGMFSPEAPLIEGYQLAFARSEPTSSIWDATVWEPVFDPQDPGQRLQPVRFGTREAEVALPDEPGVDFWLAARILYNDCTVNGSFLARPDCAVPPPQAAADPVVASHLSQHCGPVTP